MDEQFLNYTLQSMIASSYIREMRIWRLRFLSFFTGIPNLILMISLLFITLQSCQSCSTHSPAFEAWQCDEEMRSKNYVNEELGFEIAVLDNWTIEEVDSFIEENTIGLFNFGDKYNDVVEGKLSVASLHILRFQSPQYCTDIEEESVNSIEQLLLDFPSIQIHEQGFTNVLGQESHYVLYQDEDEFGPFRCLVFLLKANESNDEFFILNLATIGIIDEENELCKLLEVAKTFHQLKRQMN